MDPRGPWNMSESPQAEFTNLGVQGDILVVHEAIPHQNLFY